MTVVTAVVGAFLLLALTLVMISVQDRVRVIGREAAPQAATAADLYFALSDLDAQVTRILLAGDSDELAGSRVDALGAYRERGHQADRDLQTFLSRGAGEAEQATALRLMDFLAVYRQRVGQALAAQAAVASTPAGTVAPDALGYYTQATDLLHLRLLPDAQQLRQYSQSRLDGAYAQKSTAERAGVTIAVLLGGALAGSLIHLQVWMARRFRRTWNPALLAATALGLLLPVAATVVLLVQSGRLAEGRDRGLAPYLALAEIRALGYDAAADTGRYLVSANLSYYRDDFTEKSACLTDDWACRPLSTRGALRELAGPRAADRWDAYRTVHERILTLADAGRTGEAVRQLTGIRRGDAAFGFAYFDAAVAEVTEARGRDFARSVRVAETIMTGWSLLPGVILTVVLVLLPVGVRPRLAEYR